MNQLIPLNQSLKDQVKYYAGIVNYATNFSFTADSIRSDQRLILDLGRVKEIAEVTLNGQKLGTYWHSPYVVDITNAVQKGENFLEVEVVNTITTALSGMQNCPNNTGE